MAFDSCSSLKSVVIGGSVAHLDKDMFIGCNNLTNYTVVAANPTYCSLNGVIFNKAQTTLYLCPQAYAGNNRSYAVPSSARRIAPLALAACRRLAAISIPNSVTNIGLNAFNLCGSLTNITVGGANPAYSSVDGALFDKQKATLVQYPIGLGNASYAVPNGVTNIGPSAFAFCSHLTNVFIPDSVIGLGDSALYYCTQLERVSLSTNLASIGASSFVNCGHLATITAPSRLESIGNSAFLLCGGLTNLTFFGNAPVLGSEAFSGVPGTVYYYAGTAGWGTNYGGLRAVMLAAPRQ
jgi:hypothetical protein